MARSQEHHGASSKHVHHLTSSRGSDYQLRRRRGLIKVVRVKSFLYYEGQRGEARKRNSKRAQVGDRGCLIDLPHVLWQWFMPTVGNTRFVSRSNLSRLVFLPTPLLFLLVSWSSLFLSYTQPSSVVPFSAGVYLSIWTSFHRWQAPAWCSSWPREGGLPDCLNSNQPLLHSGEEQRRPPASRTLCFSVSTRGRVRGCSIPCR